MKISHPFLARFAFFIIAVPALSAATITVNTTADEFDTPSGANVSLREALRDAAAAGGTDVIVFAAALSGKTITLGSEIVVNDGAGVTVDASALAAGLTLSGGNAHRIFNTNAGTIFTLKNLTLTGAANPGGIGGAIFNNGNLTVTRCTFSGNSAGFGSSIDNRDTINLTQCTFSNNYAEKFGAVLYNEQTKIATLTHCTISGNHSSGSIGGGAILSEANAQMTLTNNIISGNTVASNFGNDIYNSGSITFTGANIIGSIGQNGSVSGPSPISAIPLLRSLGSYGGPTQTMALRPGSPAINASVGSSATSDQRGVTITDTPDLGAFELQTLTVNTAADELNVPAGANISLREALRDAPSGATILFNTSVFNGQPVDKIVLGAGGGEIVLSKNVIIDAGAVTGGVAIDGGAGVNRIFTVGSGVTAFMTDLTLTNGKSGGALSNGNGGALYSASNSTLTMTRCTLSGNNASLGGAIAILGNVQMSRCTIANNKAGQGGGIDNQGTLVMSQCTLSGNNSSGVGGAIENFHGPLSLTHCTISGNTASTAGGGVDNDGAAFNLDNSIVAGNTGGNPKDIKNDGSTLTRSGGNIVQSFANANGGTDSGPAAINANPQLWTIGSYGGPTQTMALKPFSPAINASVDSIVITDQRGIPIIDNPDLGAFELQTLTVNTVADELDTPAGANVSLREALRDAPEGSSIIFDTSLFNGQVADKIILGSGAGELVVGKNVLIDASAVKGGVTVDGGGAHRVFSVSTGQTAAFFRLTIIGGSVSGSFPASYGGGIFNQGTLSLTECSLVSNTATVGGGAYNANNVNAVLALVRSTVSSNMASFGGGVQNEGTLISDTSTFALNQAGTDGGAISAPFNSAVTLIHTTIAANTASGSGGGVIGDAFTAHYSIVSLNNAPTGPNQSGANFLSDQTIVNGNPLLGSLANNGGPTKTMALQSGSSGIDATNSTSIRDQRNYIRSGAPDVGAFEFGSKIPVTLANISTRAFVQAGENVMIGGFVITGSGAKKVIIRARGPSLSGFGVPNPLQDPTLELHSGPNIIATNDNWGDAANHQEITDSGFAPGNAQESAILMTLNPGAYTAIVSGVNGGTGVGIIEGFDLDHTTASKFGNISTRSFVDSGDNLMIGGFVVAGPDSDTVVVRATGPSLTQFGVANAMQDPTLELHDGNGNTIAFNDNWGDTQQAQIQASGFAPSNAAESAILQTLTPGSYTAIVSGANNNTGVAVVEVYGLN